VPEPLLEIEDLAVSFPSPNGDALVVDGVSLTVGKGETVGVVGESGSGKSMTALSVLRLVPEPGRIARGKIMLNGRELLPLPEKAMRSVRGGQVAMIFQDPMTSLNPVFTVGEQIAEAVRLHRNVKGKAAWDEAVDAMRHVHIAEPERRARQYPHELSGGMRQRVMIAMALACRPAVLLADEPTTALDVTVQAQILTLIGELRRETGMGVLLITHDLGVVAETADEINVMYAGRIVEKGRTDAIFHAPEHPYTWGLLGSIPRLDTPRGEELVPISGRPPSLINLPSGCSFHPRCPYVRDAHKRVEPALTPVEGDPSHFSACLLDSGTRKRIWTDLQAGRHPDEVRAIEVDSGKAGIDHAQPDDIERAAEAIEAGEAPAAPEGGAA
jgi:peptide/nickel transport system ATP-binding protein